MTKIFIDTEFTDLQQGAQLISIGCITEDGKHEFYAETVFNESFASDWVFENVIPLLDGGKAVLSPKELREELALWQASFASVEIAVDSTWDWHFFTKIFAKGLPRNVAAKPFMVDATPQAYEDALHLAYSSNNFRQHHALDDAKTMRLAWLVTKGT